MKSCIHSEFQGKPTSNWPKNKRGRISVFYCCHQRISWWHGVSMTLPKEQAKDTKGTQNKIKYSLNLVKSNLNWLEHKGGEEVGPPRFAATIAWPHLWSTLHCSTTTLKLFFLLRLSIKGLWLFIVFFSSSSGPTSVIRKDKYLQISWTMATMPNW